MGLFVSRHKPPIYDPALGFDHWERCKIDHQVEAAPALNEEALDEARLFANRRPHCVLVVPHEHRNELVRQVVEDRQLRRTVLMCHDHDRVFWPYHIGVRKLLGRSYSLVRRYCAVGPRVPLRIEYSYLAAYERLIEGAMEMAVADSGETWLRHSYWLVPAMRIRPPRRIMFSSNPFRTPSALHKQYKWTVPALMPNETEWRQRYIIDSPLVPHIPVGYRRAAELLEKINTVTYPPVTIDQLWNWVQRWIARRADRPSWAEGLTDAQYESICKPQLES